MTPEISELLAETLSLLNESGQPDAEHLMLLRKIAKKAKVGDYNPRKVGEALAFAEPGWKTEVTVGAMPVKGANRALQQMLQSEKDMKSAVAGWTKQPLPGAVLEHFEFGPELNAALEELTEQLDESVGKSIKQGWKMVFGKLRKLLSPAQKEAGRLPPNQFTAKMKHIRAGEREHDAKRRALLMHPGTVLPLRLSK